MCSSVHAVILISAEQSPSWRAPCREPAVAVPPAPALPAPSPAPKEALSLGHKQDLVNELEFGVSVLLTVPILLCLGGKPQTERSDYFLTLAAGGLMLVAPEGTGLLSLTVHSPRV